MDDPTLHSDLPAALARRLRELDEPPPPDFSAVDSVVKAEIERAYEEHRAKRMRLFWAVPAAGAALAAVLVAGVMTFSTFLDGPGSDGPNGIAATPGSGPEAAGPPAADDAIDFSRYDFAKTDVDGEGGVNVRDVQLLMLADRAGAAEVSEAQLAMARTQAVSLARVASRQAVGEASRAAMAGAAGAGIEQLHRLRAWVGATGQGVFG